MKIAALLTMSLACSMAMAQADTKTKVPQPPKVTKPADVKAPAQPSENEIMMAMMAAGQPGENHALLANCAGTWTVACKFRMTPDAPWQETTGTMKFRKAAFQEAGFGEAVGAAAPLYVRLDAERRYARLTPALRAALAGGSLRL